MPTPEEIRARTLAEYPDLYSIGHGNPKAVKAQKKKDFFKKNQREIIFDENTHDENGNLKPLFPDDNNNIDK